MQLSVARGRGRLARGRHVCRIATAVILNGVTVEGGKVVPVMDRRTRRQRCRQLDEDLVYTGGQLDRAVTSLAQIRLVLETFRERLPTEIFPGRNGGAQRR